MNKTATILLVDDDPYVRKVLCTHLQRSGFEVLSAAGGHDALEAVAKFKGTIHMLISDVMMPGMSGPELARTLLASRPDIKILLISAVAESAAQAGEKEQFLRKPFPPAVLLAKVEEILADDPASIPRRSPDELLRHRMREARAEYVRYSQEYDLLLALTGDPAGASLDRKLALRQAAEIRKSTLQCYAEAVRQFAEFVRLRSLPDGGPPNATT